MAVGSELPNMKYVNEMGQLDSLKKDEKVNTIVCLFRSDCEHCEYQLDVFNKCIDSLKNTRMILMTGESDEVLARIRAKYGNLSQVNKVSWGSVRLEEFIKLFGRKNTPAIFVFNLKSKLVAKFLGEVKIVTLIKYCQ